MQPKIRYYKGGFCTETFYGNVLEQIEENELMEITKCFQEIFNDPNDVWREHWSLKKAREELLKSLIQTKHRNPMLVLLKKNALIIGFSISILIVNVNHVIEDDMLHSLDKTRKERSIRNIVFHLKEIRKQTKVINFREVAIIKRHRKNLLAHILLPALEMARAQNCPFGFFWTSLESKIYDYGIGVHWKVIYTIEASKNIVMLGLIDDIYKPTKMFLETENKGGVLKEIIRNRKRYFGETT